MWPLTPKEIEVLIRRNGWETEEELVAWVEPVIEAMLKIRDAILKRYGIETLT